MQHSHFSAACLSFNVLFLVCLVSVLFSPLSPTCFGRLCFRSTHWPTPTGQTPWPGRSRPWRSTRTLWTPWRPTRTRSMELCSRDTDWWTVTTCTLWKSRTRWTPSRKGQCLQVWIVVLERQFFFFHDCKSDTLSLNTKSMKLTIQVQKMYLLRFKMNWFLKNICSLQFRLQNKLSLCIYILFRIFFINSTNFKQILA